MTLGRSRALVRSAVAAAAVAMIVGCPVAATLAQEATPSPGPDPTAEGTDTAPRTPLPVNDTTFALGQSMQIRVNADGEPNSSLANFRWTVSQLTVQAPPDGSKDGTYQVPVPDGGSMTRYLTRFGRPPVDNGVATLDVDVRNGAGVQRTVSLFPQAGELPVALRTAFTLDGQPITARELVGKSGVVTAQYTLTNTSAQPTEVTVTDLAGNPVTRTVEADVPMIAIAKTLLPQRYVGLNTGTGQFGADGRGNNQVQWVALPFAPLSKDGTATFGWSAHVTDAVIPSVVLQVAPIYLPAHRDDPSTPNVDEGRGIAAPPVNLDPAMAEIQVGLARVISGVATFTSGSAAPLTAAENQINSFFTRFGTDLQTLAETIGPVSGQVTELRAIIDALVAADVSDTIVAADDALTAERAQAIEGFEPILAQLQEFGPQVQSLADNAGLLAAGLTAGCLGPPQPSLPPDVCASKELLQQVLGSDALQDLADIVNSPEYAAAVSSLQGTDLVALDQTLGVLARQLPGVLTVLDPLLNTLDPALRSVSAKLTVIADGLANSSLDLPAADAVVAAVVSSILTSPGGQEITTGLAQTSTGVGMAKQELANYLAGVIVKVRGVEGATDEAVVDVKASVAGMKTAAARSPLVYGPLPEGTPPGMVLAGAYEFRFDAADGTMAATPWRMLSGVVLILAAGFIGRRVAGKRSSGAAA